MAGPKKKSSIGKSRLIVNAVLLILSILTMSVASYAWFATSQQATDQITLRTDGNAISIDAYAYRQNYELDGEGNPIPVAYSKNGGSALLNATKGATDSAGNYAVNFSSEALQTFAYGDLYSGELAANEANFPHLYIELRYIKPALNGFVQAAISDFSYAPDIAGFTNITQELDYQYRSTTVQNTSSSKHVNGLKAAYADSAYAASPWTSLGSAPSDIELYNNTTDISGYAYDPSYTPLNQCYVRGFSSKHNSEYYYSKATLIELRVDPLAWIKYFNANPGLDASRLNFGISFSISLNFSSTAFFSNDKAPKLVVSKTRANLSVDGGATASFIAYNFSATPTITTAFSASGVASASVSGTTIALSGISEGSAILTLTASAPSETASATIEVNVYSGPTLALSSSAMTMTEGEDDLISVEPILFRNSPTLSVANSDESVASATVVSYSVLVEALSAGTTTVTVSGRAGDGHVYSSSCLITVEAGTRSLTSIAVTSLPRKTAYIVGQSFSTEGMVVTGSYSDGTVGAVSGYRVAPSSGTIFTEDEIGSVAIEVSYFDETASFSVEVAANDNYRLVTSSSCLIQGERYLIASGSSLSESVDILGIEEENEHRSAVSSIVSSSTPPSIAYSSAMDALTLNGNEDGWLLKEKIDGVSQYLNFPGTGSGLLGATDGNATGCAWSIAFDEATGRARIQSASSSGTYLQYDSANGCFDCGASPDTVFLFTNSLSVADTSLTLVPSSLELFVGDSDGVTASEGQGTVLVSAAIADPSVASIAVDGNYIEVTGLAAGTTSLTVVGKGNTGEVRSSCPVTVTDPPPEETPDTGTNP
ncbi:MAG: pilus assembly protein N-terminal domain-containing protein [Bacilli bacterium]|jgi:uncharacterized protein YjdB|nr:pilus assembly protein N-terminal domain-containing protein [Bacilli bacterium]MCI2110736.1 pilus assembly protein N-terminal domain-containing protein [Bacilli bacterium]